MPSRATKTKKISKQKQKPFIRMAFHAIVHTKHGGKGVSRAAIATHIRTNFQVRSTGGRFNSALRNALNDGIQRGVLLHGSSKQRFKITPLGKKETKKKKRNKKK
eukprot:392882_1